MLDPDIGWINRPNLSMGTWKTDSWGIRRDFPVELSSSDNIRIALLGSSVINGGVLTKYSETISGYLDSYGFEALNFGTMLYAPDQEYLLYKKKIYQFKPDYLVVGIDRSALVFLKAFFVPFIQRQQVYIPYLKPKIELSNDELRISARPDEDILISVLENRVNFKMLAKHDAYYKNFSDYRNYFFAPVARLALCLFRRAQSTLDRWSLSEQDFLLLEAITNAMSNSAKKDSTTVIFLLLPTKSDVFPGLKENLFPSYMDLAKKVISRHGDIVVDIRQEFIGSGLSPHKLYKEDGIHFHPIANEMIAKGIAMSIKQNTNFKSTQALHKVFEIQ